MEDVVRVGNISAVDPDAGMARVYYPDRDSTTAPLHLFAFHSEYALPKVGDQVVVLHLSNDTSSGVILGRLWGTAEPPQAGMAGYKKVFDSNAWEELKQGRYTIHADEIILEGTGGSCTLSQLIDLEKRIERLERKE